VSPQVLGPSRGPHTNGVTAFSSQPRQTLSRQSPLARRSLLQTEFCGVSRTSCEAFRAWLAIVSNVLPLGYAVEARRFRPGLDYTLATSEEKEARLDVVLGLTPGLEADVDQRPRNGKAKATTATLQDHNVRGWQTGECGGWEASFILVLRE